MLGRVALVAMTVLCTAPTARGTQEARSAATGVPVRIVVTDARGRQVTGLTAADFEISEAGRLQPVRTLARGDSAPRRIGILLDDYHVSAGPATSAAVSALLEFVDQRLRQDDILFVMRPLDPASAVKPVSDRGELRSLISRFEGRKDDYSPRGEFEAGYLSSVPPTAARQRAQIVRAAMQALATAMSRVTGGRAEPLIDPAAMIVVTEGFAADDRGRERLATLRTVSRAARLANVAVYVMNPAAVDASPAAVTEQWAALASQTGGVLIGAGASLSGALAQLSSDLDGSYVATIDPPEKEDGTFRRLEVKARGKSLSVRAPSGYWAPIAAERLVSPARPSMSTYLKTPHSSGLIQPWFRMAKVGNGRIRVVFSWAARRGSGARVALSVVTFAGARLTDQQVLPQGGPSGPTQAVFESAPGPIQVSMAITDRAGKLLDTDVRYIDVPAFDSAGATIAAVEVVRTRTLREFLERQLQADIMPADTVEFDRRDRLIVRVRAFSQSGEPPEISARLLNPLGHPMRDLSRLPEVDGIPQFDLPLANYARGDYRIEIRATSGNSSTAQLVLFRLIG